jgi:hypothetical protein
MVEANQEARKVDITDLILQNRKRTYRMFAQSEHPPEDIELLKLKL